MWDEYISFIVYACRSILSVYTFSTGCTRLAQLFGKCHICKSTYLSTHPILFSSWKHLLLTWKVVFSINQCEMCTITIHKTWNGSSYMVYTFSTNLHFQNRLTDNLNVQEEIFTGSEVWVHTIEILCSTSAKSRINPRYRRCWQAVCKRVHV